MSNQNPFRAHTQTPTVRRWARTAISWLAIAIVVFGVAGVAPTPAWFARLTGNAIGTRFPCEGGRCGCASVRECWTVCQCQSLEQKLAWAAREGVDVPSFVDTSSARLATATVEPACPLCVDAAKPTPQPTCPSSPDQAESPAMPELGPMGCRGLEMLTAFALPVPVWRAETELFTLSENLAGLTSVRLEPARPVRFGDVPTPPPRRTPALG